MAITNSNMYQSTKLTTYLYLTRFMQILIKRCVANHPGSMMKSCMPKNYSIFYFYIDEQTVNLSSKNKYGPILLTMKCWCLALCDKVFVYILYLRNGSFCGKMTLLSVLLVDQVAIETSIRHVWLGERRLNKSL